MGNAYNRELPHCTRGLLDRVRTEPGCKTLAFLPDGKNTGMDEQRRGFLPSTANNLDNKRLKTDVCTRFFQTVAAQVVPRLIALVRRGNDTLPFEWQSFVTDTFRAIADDPGNVGCTPQDRQLLWSFFDEVRDRFDRTWGGRLYPEAFAHGIPDWTGEQSGGPRRGYLPPDVQWAWNDQGRLQPFTGALTMETLSSRRSQETPRAHWQRLYGTEFDRKRSEASEHVPTDLFVFGGAEQLDWSLLRSMVMQPHLFFAVDGSLSADHINWTERQMNTATRIHWIQQAEGVDRERARGELLWCIATFHRLRDTVIAEHPRLIPRSSVGADVPEGPGRDLACLAEICAKAVMLARYYHQSTCDAPPFHRDASEAKELVEIILRRGTTRYTLPGHFDVLPSVLPRPNPTQTEASNWSILFEECKVDPKNCIGKISDRCDKTIAKKSGEGGRNHRRNWKTRPAWYDSGDRHE